MSQKRKTATQLSVSLLVCGLLIWHTVNWHNNGMFLEMSRWLQTGRGYLTILYNLGLMLALGISLGFMMQKITELINVKGKAHNK